MVGLDLGVSVKVGLGLGVDGVGGVGDERERRHGRKVTLVPLVDRPYRAAGAGGP
jgi:hypothetical protein